MWDWVHEHAWLLFGVSVATLVLGAALAPMLLAAMPADYFVRERRPRGGLRHGLRALKGLLGAVLVAAGCAMLVLPGQGILTILAGLALLEFPGKRRLELWIVRRRPVRAAIAWIRTKAGQPPLILPSR